jgi:hypothetical protein
MIGTVHAALIASPQLSGFRAAAKQWRDCAGWLRPPVANALPPLASVTAIQPPIRAASHVRGGRSRRRGYHVRSEASRTVADSVCRHRGAALNVNGDDLAVSGDQYRHDDDLADDCRARETNLILDRR